MKMKKGDRHKKQGQTENGGKATPSRRNLQIAHHNYGFPCWPNRIRVCSYISAHPGSLPEIAHGSVMTLITIRCSLPRPVAFDEDIVAHGYTVPDPIASLCCQHLL